MTTPYCVIGCTRGTGLQIARQLAERRAPVLGVARDPVKARNLLPAAVEIRAGDVTDPGSLPAARLGACRAIFFAVDVTGGVGGRGFFKPASQIRAVTMRAWLTSSTPPRRRRSPADSFSCPGWGPSSRPSQAGCSTPSRATYSATSGTATHTCGTAGSTGASVEVFLTDEPGGRADIRITPPVHRLSLLRRLARADFARALIAAADAPAASARTFDVLTSLACPPPTQSLPNAWSN